MVWEEAGVPGENPRVQSATDIPYHIHVQLFEIMIILAKTKSFSFKAVFSKKGVAPFNLSIWKMYIRLVYVSAFIGKCILVDVLILLQ